MAVHAKNVTLTSLHYYRDSYTCHYSSVMIHANSAQPCGFRAFSKSFALCSKPLQFSCFAKNLCALLKTFALLLLCPKSLRFSCCVLKPCSSRAFSKSFALCRKSVHFLSFVPIAQYLCASRASLKDPALLLKSSRFLKTRISLSKNMCRKGVPKFITKLLLKLSNMATNTS